VILASFGDLCFRRFSTLNYQPVAIARFSANFFLLKFYFCFSYALRPQSLLDIAKAYGKNCFGNWSNGHGRA